MRLSITLLMCPCFITVSHAQVPEAVQQLQRERVQQQQVLQLKMQQEQDAALRQRSPAAESRNQSQRTELIQNQDQQNRAAVGRDNPGRPITPGESVQRAIDDQRTMEENRRRIDAYRPTR